MSDFKFATDEYNKISEPPSDYQPKESEAFLSVMRQGRAENRKSLEKSIKHKFENEKEEKAEALKEIFKIKDVKIRRNLINQVYKDFKAFKKQNILKERVKEIESLGMMYPQKKPVETPKKDEEPISTQQKSRLVPPVGTFKVQLSRHASRLIQPGGTFKVQLSHRASKLPIIAEEECESITS